jgi:polysaccharide biosynthesis/export protein ExoF
MHVSKSSRLQSQHPTVLFMAVAAILLMSGSWPLHSAEVPKDAVSGPAAVQTIPRLPRTEASTTSLAIGDRLKIVLFEQYAPESGATATQHGVLATLVERPDISGEYVVQEDGSIFLPLLGVLTAEGESLGQLQTLIEETFSSSFPGKAKASLQLLDREPVYVASGVTRPGAFKYIPGMTILQAVILAGGDPISGEGNWRAVDMTREEERTRKSEGQLASLYVRETILIAERDGQKPVAPPPLISLVGKATADTMIVTAARLRALERQKIEGQTTSLTESVEAMQMELKVRRESMAQAERWMQDISQRVQSLREIQKNGDLTNFTLFAARNDLSTAQDRWSERRLGIASLERSLLEARHSLARLILEETVTRETAIKEIDEAIKQEEITHLTMGRLLQQNAGGLYVRHGDTTRTYQILRRSADGLKKLKADEYTALRPGDIVQINGTDTSMRQASGN